MALTSGTKLGPYEINCPLGAGGMGEVYGARDTRLGRTVAIKILPAHLSDSPEAKQRFDREARAISALNHPNVYTLYDVGHQDGIDYLVMEFLEGQTLAARLMKGPLPLEQVLRYGLEICEGLEKAHKMGVIHRDLKPGNVMLTKSGAKLMDFGLAKAIVEDAPSSSSLTMTLSGPSAEQPLTARGTVVGTFQYMSPEQLEGKEADARSDIFALGAVLYEMATGKCAFAGKTQRSIVAAILAAEPQPISAIQPMSPPAFERVVKGCLAKDPDERLQTAHDVKLQLKWIAEGGSQAGVPAPLAMQRKTRERMLWAASALLLVLSLVLAVIHFGQAKVPRQTIHAFIPPPEKSVFAFLGDHTGPLMISPDGTRLVFAALGPDGKQMLWLRPLDASSSRPLPGTDDASYPFWSPDSRFIGFFAERKLKTVEATGGPAQVLCDAMDGRGGSWNREGIIVFPPTFNGPLYEIPSGGGTPTPVTELDSSQQETSHRWPQFLPDGRHFLFFVRSRQGTTSGAYVGSLDSKEKEKKLLFRNPSNVVYAPPGYLLFVRENTLMAQAFDDKRQRLIGDASPIALGILVNAPYSRAILSVSDNGVLAYGGAPSVLEPSRLHWMDRTGKEISALGDPGIYANPRLSPDGTRLAVAIADATRGATDIWIYDLQHGGKTRLTFDASLNYSPIWSPDGGQVVFSSNRRNGFPQLFRKAANGEGSDELLLASNTTDRPDDWSPDGRFILYEPNPTMAELWLLPTSGNRTPAVLLSGEGGTFPGEGTFSHDGKWLAFSEYSAGKREVYITSYPGKTGKWQVSVAGGTYPRWRRDGNELFFLAADKATIMAVDLDLKKAVPRIGTPKALFPVHLSLVSFLNRMGSAWDPFEVSPDGKRFLVNSPNQPQSPEPINVVVNWDASLKK
jgi:eukaryotic-like serine/threonine-protein kinase